MAGILPAMLRDTPEVEPFSWMQPHGCHQVANASRQCGLEQTGRGSSSTQDEHDGKKNAGCADTYTVGAAAAANVACMEQTGAGQGLVQATQSWEHRSSCGKGTMQAGWQHDGLAATEVGPAPPLEWPGDELAAMAAGWGNREIDRCIIQAHLQTLWLH